MILLKPEGPVRVGFAAVLAVGLAGFLYVGLRWPALDLLDRALLGTAALALILFALDGLQRRYELRSGEVAVRYFFVLWSVYRLPRELRVRTDRRRRLVLSGSSGPAVAIPRAYNRLGELEKRYWHMREFPEPLPPAEVRTGTRAGPGAS